MSEEKQYPQCNAFGEHMLINTNNYEDVDKEGKLNIIYFMTSDGAHEYWKHLEESQEGDQE